MDEDAKSQEENPQVGQPYGGVNRRPEGGDLPGEVPEESAVTADRGEGEGRTPMSSRAADEPMDSDAAEPYSMTEPEPTPPNPLTRQDES